MLETYRQEIDAIDTEIIKLLSQRAEISQKIGLYKQQNNLPVFQPERWTQLLMNRQEQAKQIWLSPIFIKDLRNRIHEESLTLQNSNGKVQ